MKQILKKLMLFSIVFFTAEQCHAKDLWEEKGRDFAKDVPEMFSTIEDGLDDVSSIGNLEGLIKHAQGNLPPASGRWNLAKSTGIKKLWVGDEKKEIEGLDRKIANKIRELNPTKSELKHFDQVYQDFHKTFVIGEHFDPKGYWKQRHAIASGEEGEEEEEGDDGDEGDGHDDKAEIAGLRGNIESMMQEFSTKFAAVSDDIRDAFKVLYDNAVAEANKNGKSDITDTLHQAKAKIEGWLNEARALKKKEPIDGGGDLAAKISAAQSAIDAAQTAIDTAKAKNKKTTAADRKLTAAKDALIEAKTNKNAAKAVEAKDLAEDAVSKIP